MQNQSLIIIKKFYTNKKRLEMLKILINSICFFVGRFLSAIYSYNFHSKLLWINYIIYTSWVSKSFRSFGRNSVIQGRLHFVGGEYITIGNETSIGKRGVITAWCIYKNEKSQAKISIGDHVCIGDDCHITAINHVLIGDNVLMGKKITITDNGHGKSDLESISIPPIERTIYSAGPVIIEEGVWIGDKVSILANVRIGKNAIIGSNAVVTKDIPANSIAGGIPATVIRIIK
jgi:acetyltransferase-like isoleucine patch superfamily enzyme